MAITKTFIKEMAMKRQGEFVFSFDELKELQPIFKDFGGNVVNLVQDTITEDDKSFISRVTDPKKRKKLYERDYLIKIDPQILDNVQEFVSEGLELMDWYHDMSRQVFSALGESDGCLFLLLVASTSPQNMLTKNLIEASQIYEAVKVDMTNNEETLRKFVNSNVDKSSDILDELLDEYEKLELYDVFFGNAPIDIAISKIRNVKNSISIYVRNNGSLDKETALQYIASGINIGAKYKKDMFKDDAPIRALKVANFAINLIEPDYKFNNDWYAVTIDTWMIRFFYPELQGDRFDKVRSGIFGSPDRYFYLSKVVADKAKEIGMEPNQLQASIWVSKLKSEGKNVTSFNKVIETKIAEMEFLQGELDKTEGKFKQLITYMSRADYSTPEEGDVEGLPDDLDEPAPF